jgi:DNA-binding transcriptional LysR family regulator
MISAFLEVARTGSLGSAAKNLGRSQPLLTHHIRRIEDILGCVLFERSPRGAILTAQGEVFLPFAKRLMAVSDQAVLSMASLSDSNTKKLRIFISEDLVGEAFLKALAEKHSLLQEFDLEIAPAGEAPSAKAFERGEVDIFFGDPSPALADAAIGPPRIATAQLVWVASPGFDVFKRPLPFALYPPGCAWQQPILETLEKKLEDWEVVMESGSLAALQSAARSGVAVIACLPPALGEGLIALDPSASGLPPPPAVQVAMYRGNNQKASKQVEDFLWGLTLGAV